MGGLTMRTCAALVGSLLMLGACNPIVHNPIEMVRGPATYQLRTSRSMVVLGLNAPGVVKAQFTLVDAAVIEPLIHFESACQPDTGFEDPKCYVFAEVSPGTYQFSGFSAGQRRGSGDLPQTQRFTVRPWEVLYIGNLDGRFADPNVRNNVLVYRWLPMTEVPFRTALRRFPNLGGQVGVRPITPSSGQRAE